MMRPARALMEKVKRGEVTTGILATDHVWPDLIEISQRAELDYVIVDLEHGPHASDVVAEVCATGRRLSFPVLIRPRSNDYATLRWTIDQGCCGFLLASVESAAELDVVREAVCVPPRGRRRPGGRGNRWVDRYDAAAWQSGVEDDFIVLPQIETLVGMEHLADIAGHEMTTCLAVGPYDLSAELGVCGAMDHPRLCEALATILSAARAASKPGWMIGSNPAALVRDGWTFLCLGEPGVLLQSALRSRADEARQALENR